MCWAVVDDQWWPVSTTVGIVPIDQPGGVAVVVNGGGVTVGAGGGPVAVVFVVVVSWNRCGVCGRWVAGWWVVFVMTEAVTVNIGWWW